MKPHEETWRLERGDVAHPEHFNHLVKSREGVVGLFIFESEAKMATAAPEMARALLALTSKGHTPETLAAALDAGMRALAKAGVLP